GEIPGNGSDDDHNGVIDDVYGYDSATNDGNPMDVQSHGSHCAGTIAAVGNNNLGVVGVNWTAAIMAVRIALSRKRVDAPLTSSVSVHMGALDYIMMMKQRGIDVRVTSNSWTNGGCGKDAYSAPQKE